ncbi:hypothetical protein N7532_009585 [Penicillium argentinense]|uniref:Zn(2)-C6 fungal-type domain-containing protein n=1 Tax=Penicillium argentinense TaxID=1131581 RepID=A0A9W9K336_9EURO|nr:uncharacterized protein N7532_009585 [Penicillium argentinense]KAJ5090901.1 hypothetical protein N7532_009585 [Penicillium argentinense]
MSYDLSSRDWNPPGRGGTTEEKCVRCRELHLTCNHESPRSNYRNARTPVECSYTGSPIIVSSPPTEPSPIVLSSSSAPSPPPPPSARDADDLPVPELQLASQEARQNQAPRRHVNREPSATPGTRRRRARQTQVQVPWSRIGNDQKLSKPQPAAESSKPQYARKHSEKMLRYFRREHVPVPKRRRKRKPLWKCERCRKLFLPCNRDMPCGNCSSCPAPVKCRYRRSPPPEDAAPAPAPKPAPEPEYNWARQATLYDAVAGKCYPPGSTKFEKDIANMLSPGRLSRLGNFLYNETGKLGRFRDTPKCQRIAGPEEVVFCRERNLSKREAKCAAYMAHENLPADCPLPSSDLLETIHAYTADFYRYALSDGGRGSYGSMDETALLAMGILIEELATESLGKQGYRALLEAEPKAGEICQQADYIRRPGRRAPLEAAIDELKRKKSHEPSPKAESVKSRSRSRSRSLDSPEPKRLKLDHDPPATTVDAVKEVD